MIKIGDKVVCIESKDVAHPVMITGVSVWNNDEPYRQELKLRCGDGRLVVVKGWLCVHIIVNDIEV